ncbi:MAG TPA: M4 family metallopeptidase [Anaerolineales bacterium]
MSPHMASIFCILPPYMLERVAQQGSPEQRQTALRTLQVGVRFQAERALRTEVPALVFSTPVVGKQRAVFDAEFGSGLPGRLVRGEGEPPTGDPAVDEAYDGSGATYDLYQEVYERDSIDDNGMRLDSTVHYGRGFDNAFWNGQQMVYGDGDEDLPEDQRLFNRFTIALGIIGHELAHGVTQFTAGLVYRLQPGALNESMSDVFGSLVKQRARGQTADQADWLVGEGLFTANVTGVAIRSLKAPGTAYDDPVLGKDPQPAHMNDYKDVAYDNGGVHINSGIPNHAFYVMATEIGGDAWEKAGRIWYVTLRDKLGASSQFADAARLTYQTAGELYGSSSLEQNAVRTGWAEVGLSVEEEGRGCGELVRGLFRSGTSQDITST